MFRTVAYGEARLRVQLPIDGLGLGVSSGIEMAAPVDAAVDCAQNTSGVPPNSAHGTVGNKQSSRSPATRPLEGLLTIHKPP